MERRLSAILAADIVGYSRLMEQDEAGTFERLRALRSELFEPAIARHHGRVFKLMGDGLLAEFGSVVDAVECATILQRGMVEPNAVLPPDKRIHVRVGIHCGDVIVEGEDRHGDAVNIAARLQQLSEPGGIAVSGTVADGVKHKLALRFEPQGEVRLKNIAEPLAIFRVRTDAAAAPPAVVLWLARLRRRPGRLVGLGLFALVLVGIALASTQHLRLTPQTESAASSIAVLPFENMSGDPALDYFSDGITENIIGGLARSPDLHVTSRTSTAAYKGKPTDVREIGRALNVRYVLEGSVQKGSDAVRIIAQLIDAGSGEHVWADRFDRESRDPLALQDEVTGRVIASLAGHQGAIQKQAYHDAWGKDRANLQEYDYYLRGHSLFFQWTKEDMAKARAIFQEGLVKFPDSGLLRVKIGWTHYQDWANGWSEAPAEDLRRAYELAQDGLAQPNKPPIAKWYGHWLLALTLLYHEKDAAAAALEAEVARKLAPNDPNTLIELAGILVWAGKPEQAIAWMQQAMQSGYELWGEEPISLAMAYQQLGQHEAAIKVLRGCDGCSEFRKNWYLMVGYLRLGRLDEARNAVAALRKARPDFSIAAARGDLYYANAADTERAINELRKMGIPEM
jgi:TolB-like protein/class 3 adenylate cyclase